MTVKLCLMCKEGEGLVQVRSKGWTINASNLSTSSLAPKDNGLWETEGWVINSERVFDLLGSDIVLTQSRNTPAYMGGTVKGFTAKGKRITLQFQENPELRGYEGHIGKWQSCNPVFYL